MRHSGLFIPAVLILQCFSAPAQSAFAQVVLVGKVTQLKAAPQKNSTKEWAATVVVEVVESGDFVEQTLLLCINSPSKPLMEVGKRYRIRAEKIKGQYTAQTADIKPMR